MLKTTVRCSALPALLATLAMISGCRFANFANISEQPEFTPLISTSYSTKIPLLIHGVNMDQPIAEDIDQYTITPEPGIGGREIKTRDKLPVGTVFEIKAIWECTNCYLDFAPRRKIEIELTAVNCCSDHPVYLRTVWGDMEFLMRENDAASLNSEYFEKRGAL